MDRIASQIVGFVFLVAMARVCGGASLQTLDGRRLEGDLATWTDDGVTLSGEKSEAQPRLVAADDLLVLRIADDPGLPSEWERAVVRLHLSDGSVIPATMVKAANRKVRFATPWAAADVSIATRDVELLAFGPLSPPAQEAWVSLERENLPGDVLLVAKKGGESVDYLAGTVKEIGAEEVEFEWDGEQIPVQRSKIAAIAFYRGADERGADVVCRLRIAGGLDLATKAIELSAGRLTVATPLGLKFRIPLAAVASADYSAGKLAYLSDLKPLDSRWTPFIELPAAAKLIANYAAPRFDRAFDGGPLRLAGAPPSSTEGNPKGLALRSRTQIAYDVPAGMTRFAATAGIHPECAAQGDVELTLFGDREALWKGEVSGRDKPRELAVDLAGARRLRIVVDFGANRDLGDQLHLVNARFSK